MKKIEAIIKPFRLDDVKLALSREGVGGLSVTAVKGFGRQRGLTEIYKGSDYNFEFIPKMKLEMVVDDSNVDRTVAAIVKAARTGKIGDGKIFVFDIEQCVRVPSGELVADGIVDYV